MTVHWLLWRLIDRLLVLNLLVHRIGLKRELNQLLELTTIEKDSLALIAVVDVDTLAVNDHHDFGALWAKDVH